MQSGHAGELQPWSVCLHAPARHWHMSGLRLRYATWGMFSRSWTTWAIQTEAEVLCGQGGAAGLVAASGTTSCRCDARCHARPAS